MEIHSMSTGWNETATQLHKKKWNKLEEINGKEKETNRKRKETNWKGKELNGKELNRKGTGRGTVSRRESMSCFFINKL